MRALLAALVLAFVPSSLSAATITFEQPFTLGGSIDHHGGGVLTDIRDRFGIGGNIFDWAVPAFDPALGIVESLLLEAPTTADVTVILEEPQGAILMIPLLLYDHIGNHFASAYEGTAVHIAYPPGSPQVNWRIELHPDSHAFFDIGANVTLDVLITGTATATYFYEPAATAVPEPATLVLLGSGLIGAAWRRKRR